MRKCTTEVSRLKAVMERAGRRQVVLVEEEGARLRMCVCVCERERETEREGKRGREGGREGGRERRREGTRSQFSIWFKTPSSPPGAVCTVKHSVPGPVTKPSATSPLEWTQPDRPAGRQSVLLGLRH